jgi:hypothetical protein
MHCSLDATWYLYMIVVESCAVLLVPPQVLYIYDHDKWMAYLTGDDSLERIQHLFHTVTENT